MLFKNSSLKAKYEILNNNGKKESYIYHKNTNKQVFNLS